MSQPLSALSSASAALAVIAEERSRFEAGRSQGHTEGHSGVDLIATGNRHNAVVQIVGALRRQGYSDKFIASIVGYTSQRLMEEPGDPEKLLDIVRSTGAWTEEPQPDIEFEVDEAGGLVITEGTNAPRIIYASQMEDPEPIEWLWEHYFPLGFVTMLAGVEGIGKGMMSTYLAVREAKDGRQVIWLPSEDDPQRDILKRLRAAEWDRDRDAEINFWDPMSARFTFPRDEALMIRMIEAIGSRLLIIDPGRSFVTPPDGEALNYNNEAHVRPAMESLTRVANATGASVLFVHHYNKNTDGSIRNRSGGTGAFSQVVRHRVDVAKAGTDDWSEWAMAVVKSNVAVEGFLRSYTLPASPEHETATFLPGERLTDHPDIATWEKARQSALSDAEKAPVDDYSMIELALDTVGVVGQIAPGADRLADVAGIPEKRARAALAIMAEQGRLAPATDGSSRRIWRG